MRACKILIVDDQEEFRWILRDFIDTLRGFEIVGEAKDGTEAIDLTKSLSPDLILMDISMPRMGGISSLSYIKELSPTTKIVLVTVHDGKPYRTLARYVGADGYVSKGSLKQDLPKVLVKCKNKFLKDSKGIRITVGRAERQREDYQNAARC